MYTGNTYANLFLFPTNTVYPCVYREHTMNDKIAPATNGLSLCIQGTPRQRVVYLLVARFIPVYTGNTILILLFFIVKPVYPCVYREHCVCCLFFRCNCGLSLCVQGTPPRLRKLLFFCRFIPVCTGNTESKHS